MTWGWTFYFTFFYRLSLEWVDIFLKKIFLNQWNIFPLPTLIFFRISGNMMHLTFPKFFEILNCYEDDLSFINNKNIVKQS